MPPQPRPRPRAAARRAISICVCLALVAALPLAGAALALPGRTVWLLAAAPLLEEIVFRAGLQDALLGRPGAQRAEQALAANVITACTFAACHLLQRPEALGALTVLPALFIGRVYQQGRRLAPCIALHALFNAIWCLHAGLLTGLLS